MAATIALKLTDNQIQTLTQRQKQLANELEHTYMARAQTVAELKAALTEALHAQADFAAIEQAAKTQATTLTLVHPSVEIRNLPWRLAVEHLPLLYLSKAHQVDLPQAPLQYGFPLKILVMVSAPVGARGLDFEHEEAQLLKAFNPLMEEGLVQVHFTDDGSLEDLERKLQDNHYHILHFSGHGVYEKDIGYLILEDQVTGNVRKVTAQDFNAVLARAADLRHRPELVVLSACQTAQAQTSGETGGVADTLLNAGQAAVVAMSASILDNCATYFAAAFYRRLAEGLPLPRAFKEATADLRNYEAQSLNFLFTQSPNHTPAQWLIPQLLMGKDLPFIADRDKAVTKLNFKEDAKYVTGEKDLLRLRVRPKNYVFIGRRKDKRAVFHQLLEGKAILLRGQGGVGKTALAEHLTIRLMAYSQRYKPFTLTEKELTADTLLNKMRDYLSKEHRQMRVVTELAKLDKFDDKLAFLLEALGGYCDPVFVFDNIETFQDNKTGAWLNDRSDILETIQFIQQYTNYPLLLTGRYPLPEVASVTVHDLNAVPFNEFLKKCWQLPLSALASELHDSRREAHKYQNALPDKPLSFEDIARQLHTALGGNYRALEFFDELYAERGATAVFGTLDKLTALSLEQAFKAATADVRQRMRFDLVFQELLALLTPQEQEVLQLLAHFNIPVLPMAISQQRDNADFNHALHRLANLTLAERQTVDNDAWFYIMPLVKDLLKDSDLPPVAFSADLAGDYHDYIVQSNIHVDISEYKEAFDFYEIAQNVVGVNKTGDMLCNFYYGIQQFQLSYNYGIRTHQLCGEATDSRVWNNLGLIFQLYGKLEEALYFFEKSLNDDRKKGDRQGEGTTLNNISQIHKVRGDYDKALTYLEQSLAIRQQIGDRKGEGTTLNNISQIYDSKGDYDKALDYLEQSLAIQQSIGDRKGEGTTLNNISQIYAAKGDYDKALDYLEQSLAIRQSIGDRKGEGTTLNNLATTAHAKGDYDKALDYLEQSLAIQQSIGDRKGEGTTLNNISQIHKVRGDYDKALTYLEQSLAIQQSIGDRQGEGTTLNNISQIYAAKGDYDKALTYLEQSLAIRQSIGDIAGLAATLNNMGAIYLNQKNDIEQAVKAFMRSYQILHQLGSPNVKYPANYLNAIIEDIGEARFKEIMDKLN